MREATDQKKKSGRTARTAMGATVALAVLLSAGAAAGASRSPDHRPVTTSHPSARQLLLIQVAELSSEALEVTNAVEIWGCEQAAANTPGVNAELGPEVAAHALTTCRPVPPTDSSFPTSVVNPGPEEFGPEIAFFQEFGGGTLSTRWSGTVTQLMVQLRSTASGLAQTLGVGANDQIWSSQIRTYLIKLVTLIPKLEQVLKSGH